MTGSGTSLPIVDVAPLREAAGDVSGVVDAIRAACLDKGFFYCVGHGIEADLRGAVFRQAETFFSLPESEKLKADKRQSRANRGYEMLRGQTLEPGTPPDLKEGYYIGAEVCDDDPRASRLINVGPNVWPAELPGFRAVMERYFAEMGALASTLLRGLALSLELPDDHFAGFERDPLATLRLLHYPPQPAVTAPGEKGCGAHTDFGGITILMQDQVGGLQVWDNGSQAWIDAPPIADAFIVNLGDLMGRWTNDRYRSTLHRVINASGLERYSVPFFFSGNHDFRIECLPTCQVPGENPKYPPTTVDAHIRHMYARTYG
jgi:isopenicillin N synthase-like dioxygenase